MNTAPKSRILIIDDEEDILFTLKYLLSSNFIDVITVNNAKQAFEIIKTHNIHVAVTDQKMPDTDGITLLKWVKTNHPDIIRILMTGYTEMDIAISAINEGDIFHFIPKPWDPKEFKMVISHAIKKYKSNVENEEKYQKLNNEQIIRELMGPSDAMKQIANQINQVYDTTFTILFIGESGTGKEVLCNAIYRLKDSNKELISINCGAIPENLLESELFGYEKGAFTGASSKKIGLIESAQNGVLFLDEISELPLLMQTKLLRVLQEKKIRRLGSNKDINIRVRFIIASNKDLIKMVNKNEFRQDLYYRIAEYTIHIPPLRERKSDIVFLAEKLIHEANQELGKGVKISDEALEALLNYTWPGNVRELRNVIRKSVLTADEIITIKDLDIPEIMGFGLKNKSEGLKPSQLNSYAKEILGNGASLKDILNRNKEKLEKDIIEEILKSTKGNKSKASKLMQIDYKTLYNKIKEYGIQIN